jgi:hypothetical protein
MPSVGLSWCELAPEGSEGEAGCRSMLLGALSLRASMMNCLKCTKLHVSPGCYYVFEMCPKKVWTKKIPRGVKQFLSLLLHTSYI